MGQKPYACVLWRDGAHVPGHEDSEVVMSNPSLEQRVCVPIQVFWLQISHLWPLMTFLFHRNR